MTTNKCIHILVICVEVLFLFLIIRARFTPGISLKVQDHDADATVSSVNLDRIAILGLVDNLDSPNVELQQHAAHAVLKLSVSKANREKISEHKEAFTRFLHHAIESEDYTLVKAFEALLNAIKDDEAPIVNNSGRR